MHPWFFPFFSLFLGSAIWLSPVPDGLSTDAWQLFAIFAATIFAVVSGAASIFLAAIVALAVAILSAASSELPDNQILCLARLHSLVRASRAQEALRGAVAFLKSHPGSRGGLLACSEAAHALGMTEKAQRWHRMATG